MEIKRLSDTQTQVKFSNKQEQFAIKQLKFFGATPTKESSTFTYFEFNSDMETTKLYLGVR